MSKKKDLFFILVLLFIFVNIFSMENLNELILDSCNIWLNNLVPSILPFYITCDLLINYGFINILKLMFKNIFIKLFKVSESSIFVIIFSMLTGFPSSAKYIKDLIKEDLISVTEANKIIRFCHFSNPLFIINVIGLKILKNKQLGYLILASHFLANFIIAFIFRNERIETKTNNNFNQEKFGIILTNSIINTFNSLLIILGNLITFRLLIQVIFKYFSLNPLIKSIISIILEITTGIFSLNNINLNVYSKAIIITIALSFGGTCIHSQVYGILSDTNISYKNYLSGRILQAIIAAIILIILLSCYCI